MSSQSESKSPLFRFLDAFLQEENIKWVLGLGVCLLLGSSLRLVTTHWQDCTPVWKYLILLGYTSIVFLLSRFSYFRLGLRKTGTVLMALTVLLIPLSFLALHWVRPAEATAAFDVFRNTGLTLLLGVNLAWSYYAARQTFAHFLRKTEPTFLISYLALCVSGAVVPGLPVAWAPVLALALWAVFAAGTIKVNRHVFWMTEEQRLPRIFGFFPIALLGAQFAAVFALGIAPHLSIPMLGLLCTLMAVPILLTADSLAKVFEQRTGGIVRPIPWSIIGPLFLGTVLSLGGVMLAITHWPANPLVVPTAALAAGSFAVMARRTQKSAFVWLMVGCILVTYQTCPAFFKELVIQLRDQAAAAVRESRLPYAFYGLTYAPLIVAFTLASAWLRRQGSELFAQPLRVVALGLPWLLFAASFTHPSAVLPVAALLCPLFLLQAKLFRSPLPVLPAGLAVLAIAFGIPGFCERVLAMPVSVDTALLLWTLAAGLLLVPGCLADRWAGSLRRTETPRPVDVLFSNSWQGISLAATLVAAIWCGGHYRELSSLSGVGNSALVGLLLIVQALRWCLPVLGEVAFLFAIGLVQRMLIPANAPWTDHLPLLSLQLVGIWVLSYVLLLRPQSRLSRALARPAFHVSAAGLCLLYCWGAAGWVRAHFEFGLADVGTSLLLLLWSLDAGRRAGNSIAAGVTWGGLLLFSTAAFTQVMSPAIAQPWFWLIWVMMGLVLLEFRRGLVRMRSLSSEPKFELICREPLTFSQSLEYWTSPLTVLAPVLWVVIAVATLPILGWPQQLAGLLALVGLVYAGRVLRSDAEFDLLWPLVNWHLLAGLLTAAVGTTKLLHQVTATDWELCGLPLAALAGVSALVFESRRVRRQMQHAETATVHQVLLLITAGLLLAGAVSWHGDLTWTALDVICVLTVWLSVALVCWSRAVRSQQVELVWWGLASLAGAWLYFVSLGLCSVTNPWMAYVLVGLGISLSTLGRAAGRTDRFRIFSTSFLNIGFWLPVLVVPMALGHAMLDRQIHWAGANSLPLLCAAGFYFYRGVYDRQVGTSVLSAAICNLATMLLWSELRWTDPQLFLMPIGISILLLTELLQREIPASYHTHLRFVGALTILVSPTFHIVTGSWLHILTLMVAAVALALVAIGLRVRVMLYTSSAFLLADLAALVVRGSIEQPNLLWIVGVLLGSLVIALGAVCENHRETVLARIRGLAATLEQWQ